MVPGLSSSLCEDGSSANHLFWVCIMLGVRLFRSFGAAKYSHLVSRPSSGVFCWQWSEDSCLKFLFVLGLLFMVYALRFSRERRTFYFTEYYSATLVVRLLLGSIMYNSKESCRRSHGNISS
jgi:hypothetical protein